MTPYEEIDSPADMRADCEAVTRRLDVAASKAVRPAPSIHYDEFPQDLPKPGIQVSEAAQRLAAAIFE
ncbi:MAG: hypothetical protein FWE71_12250 [Nocardioidaceae bacterium]|nr:hypothetical protein [Nocardioidaceae bacterium]MCL2614342.1 hypothetical protein [Nocardioidaceae bacterium]